MTEPEDFDDGQLEHLMEDDESIPELDVGDDIASSARVSGDETTDSGVRRRPNSDAEMGLGAEPRDADELADAAIGRALGGDAGVTRDDEAHGEHLLDAVDEGPRDERTGSLPRREREDRPDA